MTFRARLTQLSTSPLTGFLEAWISSEALIFVQAQFLSVDGTCDVIISSFNEGECRSVVGTAAGTTDTLIGAVVGGVLILVLLSAIIVICVVLWKQRRKAAITSPPV